MITVFIVNPKAGKGKKLQNVKKMIAELACQKPDNVLYYETKAPGDATRFVQEYYAQNGAARFIACGGDGTFSEVVNGAMGCMDAQVGVLPIGTGNDFCRNFPKDTYFHNIYLQTTAEAIPCDVIRYTTEIDGETKVGYCANMFNIGFDCNVADKTLSVKEKTVFSGPMAYFVSIFISLIQKKTISLTVEADGGVLYRGNLLLTSVANGCYCGGGIKSNPFASLTDGKLNVNLIQDISRRKFLSLLPFYMKGTHHTLKGIESVVQNIGCKTLTITPHSGQMRISIDGEVITTGKTTFEVIPNAIKFAIPLAKESKVMEKTV